MRILKFVLLCFAFALSACSTVQKESAIYLGSENVKQKNYSIGQKMTVSVGDPMIKFRDYWTVSSERSTAVIDRSVSIKGGPVELNISSNKEYVVAGSFVDDGITYTLVEAEKNGHLLMVKPDGTLRNRIGTWWKDRNQIVTVIYTMTISDPRAIVTTKRSLLVDQQKGYENYELIYTGVGSGNINLTYREFSPEGLARVAFFQNLTYPATAKTISFKRYKMNVISANPESITFAVVEDGDQ